MCERCRKRPAKHKHIDMDETVWHLCGYCLRVIKALDKQWQKVLDPTIDIIDPDEWSEQ